MIHKKRKKNASFGFDSHIQGRFRPFPACSGRFSAYFGRRPIRPDMADTARFWPNQPDSAQIEADSARIEPHRRESSRVGANPRKKKIADAVRRAGNRGGRGCGTSGAVSVLSRSYVKTSLKMCKQQAIRSTTCKCFLNQIYRQTLVFFFFFIFFNNI